MGFATCASNQLKLLLVSLSGPLLDGANEECAGVSVDNAGAELFFHAWHNALNGGMQIIGEKGLPWILFAIVVTSTFKQIMEFMRNLEMMVGAVSRIPTFAQHSQEHSEEEERCRIKFWGGVAQSADVVGLSLTGQIAASFLKAHPLRMTKGYCLAFNRVMKTKGPETLPIVWFGTSLLQLSFRSSSPSGLVMTFIALGTSLAAAGSTGLSLIPEVRERINHEDFTTDGDYWRLPYEVGFLFAMISLLAVTTLIRIWGVFTCPSHVLNISTMHCVALPSSSV